MLRWSLAFLLIATVAAFTGFGNGATPADSVVRAIFYGSLLAFAVALIIGLSSRGGAPRE